jgi:hypothetical protein
MSVMTPRDRLLTTLRGGAADRVPLVLEGFHHRAADAIKEGPRRALTERILPETHYFHHVPSLTNRYLVTPSQRMRSVRSQGPSGSIVTTTVIDTPKGTLTAVTARNALTDTEWTVKYPVECRSDIEAIRSIPWEVPAGLKAFEPGAVAQEDAERRIVQTSVSSPFVCVAGMMPYQQFLELCATDLPLVRDLAAVCLDRTLAVLGTLLSRPGIEYVWIGGCEWLTPPMGSPALYGTLVQPLERAIIERAHAAGAVAHVHCHGRVRSTLPLVIDRGADFLEPVEPPPDGDVTFAEAKAAAAGRLTLGGNVEARVLENGDPRAVEAACRAAFDGGKRRMVFQTSAGPIGPVTERMARNYRRLIDAWEELSGLD